MTLKSLKNHRFHIFTHFRKIRIISNYKNKLNQFYEPTDNNMTNILKSFKTDIYSFEICFLYDP